MIWCSERTDERVQTEIYLGSVHVCLVVFSYQGSKQASWDDQSMPVIISDPLHIQKYNKIYVLDSCKTNVLTDMQINAMWNAIRIRLTLFLSAKSLIYIRIFKSFDF